jgi:TolB-like protein
MLLLVSGCALLDRDAGPAIELERLEPDHRGPRRLGSTPIRWTASAKGGTGELTYEFRTSSRGSIEVVQQKGAGSTWDWTPEKAGTFRVRVTIRDASGASVESGWSPPYVILPSATRNIPIAVLPIENLSGERAPIEVTVQRLRVDLEEKGFRLVDEEILARFMHRHRIRVAGGLSRDESRAIRDATGAGAVLIISVAAYRESPPPEVSLFARLVSSGDQPEILWMESVGLSGEDEVGLLGLGRIWEAGVLLDKVVQRLTDSLARNLPESAPGAPRPDAPRPDEIPDGGAPPPVFEDEVDARIRAEPDGCDPHPPEGADVSAGDGVCGDGSIRWHASSFSEGNLAEIGSPRNRSARYAPRITFRSPIADAHRRYSVAVVPFLNLSERKNAGKIMTLHFVEELNRVDGLRVVDPGLVREKMLQYRTVIPAGPSLSTADLLSSDGALDIDLVLSGRVFDYGGTVSPKVDFTLEIIETASREIVWKSRSYNHGAEGVFFLDAGRVYTPHRLAVDMAGAAIKELRH